MLDFSNLTFCEEGDPDHGVEAFYGGADCVCLAASRVGHGGDGDRAQAGDQRADVLPLEEEVRRPRRRRVAEVEDLGGRESEAEAVGGRSQPGQEDAAGRLVKKVLRPERRRDLVERLQVTYQVAERRACRVLGFPRARAGSILGLARCRRGR